MSNFRVTLEGRIQSTSGELDAEVSDALHMAMSELYKLGTANPAIMLDFSDGGRLEIRCSVVADDLSDAVPPASVNIRSALHAAEIGTPDWPGSDDPRWTVEFFNTRSEALVLAE